ncbi:MAG: fibronectin type III domain-containing protein, partial [bacterium]
MNKAASVIFLVFVLSVMLAAQQTDSLPSDSLLLNDSLGMISTQAAKPLPPTNLVVKDVANDAGGAVLLSWDLSPDDQTTVTSYAVMRGESREGPFEVIGMTTQGQSSFA